MISREYSGLRWLDDIHPIATARLIARRDAGAVWSARPCYTCGVNDRAPMLHICDECVAKYAPWLDVSTLAPIVPPEPDLMSASSSIVPQFDSFGS